MNRIVITAIGTLALLCSALHAQVPQLINYQGRVVVGSTNFNGTGRFKFALVNNNGSTTYWSNDGTSTSGSEPTNAVSLSVANGLYSVLLGDTALTNMTVAIPLSVFATSDVRLRVWFNDGTHGSQLLTPDQRVAAVGYAVIASNVVDGAITSAKIAAGAVGSSQLASGLTLAGTTSGTFSGPLTGNATSATNATNATTATNATQLGGIVAANYVQTNDARLLSETGGGSFSNSNTFAGVGAGASNTPSGTVEFGNRNSFFGFNAGNQNTTGYSNSFVGTSAGGANMTGTYNSFVGTSAGANNTTGSNNSFVGTFAGRANTTASSNSFVGSFAGNNTTGDSNSFFGSSAGSANTTGNNNTMIGTSADVSLGSLTYATAIGAGAVVSTSNTIALGRSDGTETVQIPGALNVAGTFGAKVVNTATQYNIGGSRVLSNAGTDNLFAGVSAGSSNTGSKNSFVGGRAGEANTDGNENSFFGYAAGINNDTSYNSFFGKDAGFNTTTGYQNAFFGNTAGYGNATGTHNTMIGYGADVGGANLSNATAIGALATVSQSNSLILGQNVDVGIGTSAPTARLTVSVNSIIAGENTATFKAPNIGPNQSHIHYGTTGNWFIRSAAATGTVILQDTGGTVGIGTVSPDATLTVNGTADKPGGGSWGTFSDERLKNIKGRFTPGLKAVMQLQPLRYEYKRDNALNLKSEGEHVGFSAQAVQQIVPDAVTKDDKDYLLINNDPILWTMLNAIKEQQAQIEQQRKEINALKAANLKRPKGRVK